MLRFGRTSARRTKLTSISGNCFSMVGYTYNLYWLLSKDILLNHWSFSFRSYYYVHLVWHIVTKFIFFFAERNTLISIMASFLSLSIEQQKIRVLVFDFLETLSYSTQRQKTMLALETNTVSFCGKSKKKNQSHSQ